MIDLIKVNKKEKKKTLGEAEEVEGPMNIFLPGFSLSKEELPKIKKWEVGKTYEMKIKVKMTSYRENKYLGEQTDNVSAGFDIIGIEVEGKEDE